MYVDTFLSHCTRPFANLLQLCGHNRARQRDKLAHLLEEFTALQDEVFVTAYVNLWCKRTVLFFRQNVLMHTYIIYQ